VRLNLGCGRDVREGWCNLDSVALPGVDHVCDLEADHLPFADDSVDEIEASHLLEHVRNLLPLAQELWRVASWRDPAGAGALRVQR